MSLLTVYIYTGTTSVARNSQKYSLPKRLFWPSDCTKLDSISTWAFPRTLLGELTKLPQFLSRLSRRHPLPISQSPPIRCLRRPSKLRFRHLDLVKAYPLIGPILWGHSGPLCHALSLSLLLSLSWTSMRRRRATVAACDSSDTW